MNPVLTSGIYNYEEEKVSLLTFDDDGSGLTPDPSPPSTDPAIQHYLVRRLKPATLGN